MVRWVALLVSSGCNLAPNAVLPASDRRPVDDTGTGPSTSAEAVDVLISEVLDNSTLKFVELWNGTESDIELDGYELRRYANGVSSAESTLDLDSEVIGAGETFVISGDPDAFELAFGAPDLVAQNTVLGNGDDVYELAYASGGATEVVDVYGEVGVDGTDTAWEYEGKSAQRNADVLVGRDVWRETEWEIIRWGQANPGVR